MKLSKKILSVVLSAAVALSCCVCAFAKQEEYPVVIIHGLIFDGLYFDSGTENQRNYFSEVDVPKIVFSTVGYAILSAVTHDAHKLVDGLTAAAYDVFKYISCDENGNSVYDIGTVEYPLAVSNYEDYPSGTDNEPGILSTAVERYGADNCYYFSYDWRMDPLDNADRINELVERAKADHSCDKVNLISCSLGGVNALAYLYKYGHDSVNNCLFLSSTFCGTYVASDLLKGSATFNKQPVYNYIGNLLNGNSFMQTFWDILYKSGVTGTVCSLLNRFVERNKEQVYNEVLRDCFGTMPVLWSLVLPEDYDSCIDYVFGTDNLKEKYSGLISRADALQKMMRQRERVLSDAVADGMKLSVVASYNSPLIPVYERSGVNGDAVLESSLMLGFASVADYGKTLDYTPKNAAMMSPDRVVDMSASLYRDCTWVIKDAPHVACRCGSDYSNFVFALLEADSQPVSGSFGGYSRFMRVNSEQNFIDF